MGRDFSDGESVAIRGHHVAHVGPRRGRCRKANGSNIGEILAARAKVGLDVAGMCVACALITRPPDALRGERVRERLSSF